jgi:hypothetical protein
MFFSCQKIDHEPIQTEDIFYETTLSKKIKPFKSDFEEKSFFAAAHYLGLTPDFYESQIEFEKNLVKFRNSVFDNPSGQQFSDIVQATLSWEETFDPSIQSWKEKNSSEALETIVSRELLFRLKKGFVIPDEKSIFYSFQGDPTLLNYLTEDEQTSLFFLDILGENTSLDKGDSHIQSNPDAIKGLNRKSASARLLYCPDTPTRCLTHLSQSEQSVHLLLHHNPHGNLQVIKLFPLDVSLNGEESLEVAFASVHSKKKNFFPVDQFSYLSYLKIAKFLKSASFYYKQDNEISPLNMMKTLYLDAPFDPNWNIEYDINSDLTFLTSLPSFFDRELFNEVVKQSTKQVQGPFIKIQPDQKIYKLKNDELSMTLILNPLVKKVEVFEDAPEKPELNWQLVRSQSLEKRQNMNFIHLFPQRENRFLRYIKILAYDESGKILDAVYRYVQSTN